MKYQRFEDLPVWKAAPDLSVQVLELTRHVNFERKGDLRSQLQRAAISVGNNIAEGFEQHGGTDHISVYCTWVRR